MSEKVMRGHVVRALRPLHAMAVENPCLPGTPDVNFAGGWLELKWARSWPRNLARPLVLGHPVTSEQRLWLQSRERHNKEFTGILLQVERDWMLFNPSDFPYDDMRRSSLIDCAIRAFAKIQQLTSVLLPFLQQPR